ncbi:8018_t:CDS:2 [Funneliformis caledonium]|uniref:8018_t:CDS:1 n=1 Tax=Funneliformis caledonium TaxID=1117310 RepID=A0A9N9EHD9_9GLOM|nr:8018_t:CDS:2 [Funneliformis caledonium]
MGKNKSKENHNRSNSVEIQSMDIDSSQNLHEDDAIIDNDYDQSDEKSFIKNLASVKKNEEPKQDDSFSDEESSRSFDDNQTLDDELFSDDDELFATPVNLDYYSDQDNSIMNISKTNSWILWIFKFQEKFKLPNVLINSLIGFFSLVLKDIDLYWFKEFSSTIYMARKLLNIRKKSKSFVTCTDCNKLYDIASIIPKNSDSNATIGFKCTHIEFLNHPMQSYRKSCDSELLVKISLGVTDVIKGQVAKKVKNSNFGGFNNMDEWFKMKNVKEHRCDALIWKHQQIKEAQKNHISRTLVRVSELL